MEGVYLFTSGPYKWLRCKITYSDDKKYIVIIRFWTGQTAECSYEFMKENAIELKESK